MSYFYLLRSSQRKSYRRHLKKSPHWNFQNNSFSPVVEVNLHSSSQSETVLGTISSNSDASYNPTPLPAPVHNPTPLNLKHNKLQQLKDAQKKEKNHNECWWEKIWFQIILKNINMFTYFWKSLFIDMVRLVWLCLTK